MLIYLVHTLEKAHKKDLTKPQDVKSLQVQLLGWVQELRLITTMV